MIIQRELDTPVLDSTLARKRTFIGEYKRNSDNSGRKRKARDFVESLAQFLWRNLSSATSPRAVVQSRQRNTRDAVTSENFNGKFCIKKWWSIPLRNCESFIRFRAPSLLKGWNFLVNSTVYKKVRRRLLPPSPLPETSSLPVAKQKVHKKPLPSPPPPRLTLVFYTSASIQRERFPSGRISIGKFVDILNPPSPTPTPSSFRFVSRDCTRPRSTVVKTRQRRKENPCNADGERARFTWATWLEVNDRLSRVYKTVAAGTSIAF